MVKNGKKLWTFLWRIGREIGIFTILHHEYLPIVVILNQKGQILAIFTLI